LYSIYKKNFLKTIINKIETNDSLKITTDQIGTPTSCSDLSAFILHIIKRDEMPFGIYHFSAKGNTTWFGFAKEILKNHSHSYSGKIEAVSSFKSKAERPKYSVLNIEETENRYKELNTWEDSVSKTVKQLKNNNSLPIAKIEMSKNLAIAVEAVLKAGDAIMEVYNTSFNVEFKEDKSPLTEADQRANTIINSFLKKTPIPIISEENKQIDYKIRKDWDTCWIVDPVDGTKEFIKQNGEFTVNIALVHKGKPVLGVIYVPVIKTLYFANVTDGKAFKAELSNHNTSIDSVIELSKPLKTKLKSNTIEIVGSRSHMSKETLDFVDELKTLGKTVEIVSKGSSLKFCLVAEGNADIYPRFAPTMEWDTAAGQAICNAVGVDVISKETNKPLLYNKKDLLNPWFIVSK
jgi:3'(2'), 5'-bisphosphate nucleotidase